MAARLIPSRPENQAVVSLLEALDGEFLARHGAVFAGGSRLTLEFGEYRLSRDVDLLAGAKDGYGSLRAQVRQSGAQCLFGGHTSIELPSEARVDQYGIRFVALVDGTRIKVEIVAEARIVLSPGEPGPISSVPWAALVDCYAEKLLANSDRWPDDAFLSRDLIDLAALRLHVGPIPELAWSKALDAYGRSVASDLDKAASAFQSRPEYQRMCLERLVVRDADSVLSQIELLRAESCRCL